MKNKSFFYSIFSFKSTFAFFAAVLASGISLGIYKNPAGALIGGFVFLFAATYSVLFSEEEPQIEEYQIKEANNNDLRRLAYESKDRLTPIIDKIGIVLSSIKSFDSDKYLFISRFMSEAASFEELIPNLVASYRKASRFLQNRDAQTSTDIKSLEMKLNSAKSESVRLTYEKALSEKRQILDELKHIRNNLDDCESKLYYILSTLEKIETIIFSDELNDTMSDEASKNINQQLEIFSGSVKDIAKVMKL